MTFAPLAVPAFPIWPAGDLTRPMLSMMNVRYAVTAVADPIPPGWHEVTVDHQSRLIENERVLPRAFVPRHVRGGEMHTETDFADNAWIATPHPAFGHFLPASGEKGSRDAGVERSSRASAGGRRPGEDDAVNGPGTVVAAREGSKLRMEADMAAPGYVVVSETAWPGWRAYLDGRRVRILRANQAFLAVYVPAGRHEIRLRYLPQSFVVGRTISVAVAALLLIALFIRQVM